MKPDCIIAARKGSKRIKHKNIQEVAGQPLILRSIQNALDSKIFENIYVYTDCKKTAEISILCGAKVPFIRPNDISDDKTGLKDVLCDFLKKIKKKKLYYCYVYATAFNLKPENLVSAYAKLIKTRNHMIIGVKEYESNPLRSLIIENNQLKFYNQRYSKANTNNLKKFYFHPGSFFFFKTNEYLNSRLNILKKTTYFLHGKYDIFDIDEKVDLDFVRRLEKK